jgi:dienelactone hydrolase
MTHGVHHRKGAILRGNVNYAGPAPHGRPARLLGGIAMEFRTKWMSLIAAWCLIGQSGLITHGAEPVKLPTERGDAMIAAYFKQETRKLSEACLSDITTLDQWKAKRSVYHKQLLEMLGLDPLPPKTDMKVTVTGKVEHEKFTVENLHFQPVPGLYVAANLYLPKTQGNNKKPAPAVIYVCGHANAVVDGVRYGNKTSYQHHGAWFAEHGYVCLILDTTQRGEFEGIHHGTYRHKMWWWNCRGYTPAGVEAWTGVRVIDYLQTRKEVDGQRIGVTGRSGGGAYSWWIAALDERIKVAVPVAGITDLQNHVVAGSPDRFHDGVVDGHCDCMFQVNTYRWDYAQVAAMIAPRPLLIENSDKDSIFPLDGVVRIHAKVRKIYRLYDAEKQLGLHITEGPHKDTQELRVGAFSWFNRFLKNQRPLIDSPAVPRFDPKELKVFKTPPEDQKTSTIHEIFTAKAPKADVPANKEQWDRQREQWLNALTNKSFAGWPAAASPIKLKKVFAVKRHGIEFAAYDFSSQDSIQLRLYLAHRAGLDKAQLVVLNVLDDKAWLEWLAMMRAGFATELKDEARVQADAKAFKQNQSMFKETKWAMAYVAPRGVGPGAWNQTLFKQTQIRRRFMLLGQTLDGMRVWDVRQAIAALRDIDSMKNVPLWLQAERHMAGVALYASLYEENITRLDLWHLPYSHRQGPIFLNVSRYLDTPAAVAMAAAKSKIRLYDKDPDSWSYPRAVARKLGWDEKRIQVRLATTDATE